MPTASRTGSLEQAGRLDLRAGTVFRGAYEIVDELGTGGFARVYKARQLSTGQEVAIKVLRLAHGETVGDARAQTERFRREMRLCAELSHPNIVRLLDSGEWTEGGLYAVFQCVPGSTLREVLAREGALSVREAVRLMAQVLDALSCAHERGVIHRDLKPENIMVTRTGARSNALVLDFGLGGFSRDAEGWQLPRITGSRELIGTPCYAAPEQLRGEEPSSRADLYSWGLILLECLTGELGVSGASLHDVVMKQLGPEPVVIPPWLRRHRLGRLLGAVTAKEVEKRDATIDALLDSLELIEAEELRTSDERMPSALPEGERRQLAMVSCRLTMWSLDGGAPDLEATDHLLHVQHAAIAEVAARGGGRLAGVVGDRVLLVFGYPHASEHDARRAAHTALRIVADVEHVNDRLESERRLRLDVRIGIHTGLVIVREPRQGDREDLGADIVGLTPQIATRLEELARPGEVLVSVDTQRLLKTGIGFESVGMHRLAELSGVVPVFRLTRDGLAAARLETIQHLGEPPLIGRQHQLSQIFAAWAQAQEGKAGLVLMTGEPGIGKSRLVRELCRRVPADSWLECRCVPEGQGSPLRPVVDLLLTLAQPIEPLLARYGFDLAETLPLFAPLLSIPLDDRHPPLQLTPDRRKELTLNAIVTLLLRIAEERPLVFAVEDLHWADLTTLELIALLVREAQAVQMGAEARPRLCLVLTARPTYAPAWTMEGMLLVPVLRLGPQEVEAMVLAGLAGGRAVPRALLDRVIETSDGVPLFVEEVTRALLESGTLPEAEDAGAEPDFEIPGTLRALLTARLDGLSPGARETAQLAAALGREFRYELLRAVAERHDLVLRDNLRELVDSGLVHHRMRVQPETYLFKHALVRDAAYEMMTRAARQKIHLRIANTLKQRFPSVERDRPELLAHHLEHGGWLDEAATYWKRSGDHTMARGAYLDSIQQFERGLRLVEKLPNREQVAQLEVNLLESLGMAHVATKGYAAPEVEETFTRAERLCDKLGEDIPLRVLYGIHAVHVTRSNRDAALGFLPRFHRLAERSQDPIALYTVHGQLGLCAFLTGDFALARDESVSATQWYGTDAYRAYVEAYGYDGGLWSFTWLMWSLWILGFPDRALAIRDEMLALTQTNRNPYGLAIAWTFGAYLARDRGEVEDALALSERVIAHATEQKLYFFLPFATCTHGWATAQRGAVEQGIAEIHHGLSVFHTIGQRAFYAHTLSLLAEVELGRGAAEAGLAAVEEALTLSRTLLDSFSEAEILRLKGELLLLRGQRAEAVDCVRGALDLARRQGARSFELRAAMSLTRMSGSGDEAAEPRRVLASVYDGFTEGFVSRDLRQAKALLDQVS